MIRQVPIRGIDGEVPDRGGGMALLARLGVLTSYLRPRHAQDPNPVLHPRFLLHEERPLRQSLG